MSLKWSSYFVTAPKQKVCGVFSSAGPDSRENKYIEQGRQK